ncbi:MAG: hypothetical protein WA771_07820 [Chthoniobacterales bacterium]
MIRRLHLLAAPLLLALILPAFGQPADTGGPTDTFDPSATPSPTPDEQDEESDEPNFDTITYWKAELPGGTFVVAHDSINAVSSQEYVLDGAARVTEVNVSTSGVLQPRFYFIEPVQIPGAAGEAAAQAITAAQSAASRVVPGDPIWAKVIKEYPTTTHSGTIEYRLETKQQLQALYRSLEDSWIAGRSEIFTPGGASKFDTSKEKDESGEDSDEAAEPDTVNDSAMPRF